jgi:hypothetical protein
MELGTVFALSLSLSLSLSLNIANLLKGLVCMALALCLAGASAQPAYSADSASFSPLGVKAKGGGSGVPVGTVVAWPVSSNPSDWSNWLECNGQSISSTAYPDLYAVIGGTVPDYRGLFLRGEGGKSASLGVLQKGAISAEDSVMANIRAPQILVGDPYHGQQSDGTDWGWFGTVAFGPSSQPFVREKSGNAEIEITFSGTANETRPDNKAVRYLIRSKP